MPRGESIESRGGYKLVGNYSRQYKIEDHLISDYDNRLHHGFALVFLDLERRRVLKKEKDIDVEKLAEERGVAGLVTRVEMDMGVALTAGQAVTVNTDIYHRGDRLLAFHQTMSDLKGKMGVDANIYVAAVDIAHSQRLTRLPEDIMGLLINPQTNHTPGV